MFTKFRNCGMAGRVSLIFTIVSMFLLVPHSLRAEEKLAGLSGLSGPEKQRVLNLIQRAKSEGELVYVSNAVETETNAVLEKAFKKRYGLPASFQVKHNFMYSGNLVSKVKQELKADKVSMDVISAGIPAFFYDLVRTAALLKYRSPEYGHYSPKVASVGGAAPANPDYFISTNVQVLGVVWNPKYIKENIVHWKDVLKPEYKGKIAMADVRKSGSYTNVYMGLRKVLRRDFFEKLATLNPHFWVSSQKIIDKVVSGEFPLGFMAANRSAYQRAKLGVEIKAAVPLEGNPLLPAPWAILAKAAHPNSAKLWIDFINSEEGQEILIPMMGYISCRKGIKIPPLLKKFSPSIEDINVIVVDYKSITKEDQEKARNEFREIFGS